MTAKPIKRYTQPEPVYTAGYNFDDMRNLEAIIGMNVIVWRQFERHNEKFDTMQTYIEMSQGESEPRFTVRTGSKIVTEALRGADLPMWAKVEKKTSKTGNEYYVLTSPSN